MVYLGSESVKFNFMGSICKLIISSAEPFVNGIMLLSNDNYILTDNSGTYITAKEV